MRYLATLLLAPGSIASGSLTMAGFHRTLIRMKRGAERRISQRVKAVLPAQVRSRDAARVSETLTKDLSADGVRCVLPGAPLVGEHVAMGVSLYRDQAVRVDATVVWVESVDEVGQAIVGMRFNDISTANRQLLSEYVQQGE
jgi:c-di-GMP-binding flagellar brake protein YcgR